MHRSSCCIVCATGHLTAAGFFKPLFHKLPNDARLQVVQAESAFTNLEGVATHRSRSAGKLRSARVIVAATGQGTPEGSQQGQELAVFNDTDGASSPVGVRLESKGSDAGASSRADSESARPRPRPSLRTALRSAMRAPGLLRNSTGDSSQLPPEEHPTLKMM